MVQEKSKIAIDSQYTKYDAINKNHQIYLP